MAPCNSQRFASSPSAIPSARQPHPFANDFPADEGPLVPQTSAIDSLGGFGLPAPCARLTLELT